MTGSVSSRALAIASPPAAWAGLPRSFWIARAITGAAALGLQLAGLYAAGVTFGLWVTVALCGVGALAVLLQHLVLWRGMTCSPGE
jgi:hypothetical protein